MLPDNSTLQLQRTVADLQRRLDLLESVIKVTGKDTAISAFGDLTITSLNKLTINCGGNRSDSVAGNYALTVNGSSYKVTVFAGAVTFETGQGLRSNKPLATDSWAA
jgi:hypothetical protein